jgi:ABC-type sugar transport system substrate-binding protein
MSEQSKLYIKSFTGPEVYEEGKMAADSSNKTLNGKGSVVIIAGQAGNGTTIGRVGGFRDRLKELGSKIEDFHSVNADLDQQRALVASRDLINRFGDKIDGIYANDDTMARGFIDACKEVSQGKPTPPIVGINGQKDASNQLGRARCTQPLCSLRMRTGSSPSIQWPKS